MYSAHGNFAFLYYIHVALYLAYFCQGTRRLQPKQLQVLRQSASATTLTAAPTPTTTTTPTATMAKTTSVIAAAQVQCSSAEDNSFFADIVVPEHAIQAGAVACSDPPTGAISLTAIGPVTQARLKGRPNFVRNVLFRHPVLRRIVTCVIRNCRLCAPS